MKGDVFSRKRYQKREKLLIDFHKCRISVPDPLFYGELFTLFQLKRKRFNFKPAAE